MRPPATLTGYRHGRLVLRAISDLVAWIPAGEAEVLSSLSRSLPQFRGPCLSLASK